MNKSDLTRDYCMLRGPLAKKGYDWWWHSFTAEHAETGERKSFYIEYFLCNPALAQEKPVIVWNDPKGRKAGKRPSYCMVNVGFWGREKGQLHRFFPWNRVSIPMNAPLNLQAGDCSCTETHMAGSVRVTPEEASAHPEWMSDAGEMEWDLNIHKLVAYNVGYGASKFFRSLNAFEMFWHAEGMKTACLRWAEAIPGPSASRWDASCWDSFIMKERITNSISVSSGQEAALFSTALKPTLRFSGRWFRPLFGQKWRWISPVIRTRCCSSTMNLRTVTNAIPACGTAETALAQYVCMKGRRDTGSSSMTSGQAAWAVNTANMGKNNRKPCCPQSAKNQSGIRVCLLEQPCFLKSEQR